MTSMSSKIIGSEMKFFSQLVVEAMQSVKTINGNGDIKYPTKLVNIVRCHGGSTTESTLFKGYILQMMRASQQMRTRVQKAKVACLDINLHKFKMQMGVQVLIDDPANLEKIRQRECDILKERIMKIVEAGANVIITTKGIDDIANKYMVENGVLGLRRVNKGDLRRIAKSIGAEVVTSMA
jgi:T-complex protein 1 subunit alpha